MTYDVVCPFCGRINHKLYLEETEGWMECECCGKTAQNPAFRKMARIPTLKVNQIKKRMPMKLDTATAQ